MGLQVPTEECMSACMYTYACMYVHNCAYIYTYRQTYIHRRDRESALFSLLSLHLLEPGCVGKYSAARAKEWDRLQGWTTSSSQLRPKRPNTTDFCRAVESSSESQGAASGTTTVWRLGRGTLSKAVKPRGLETYPHIFC